MKQADIKIYIIVDVMNNSLMYISTSKKRTLDAFSDYKYLGDSEYAEKGIVNAKYELREYPQDYKAYDCQKYKIIDTLDWE